LKPYIFFLIFLIQYYFSLIICFLLQPITINTHLFDTLLTFLHILPKFFLYTLTLTKSTTHITTSTKSHLYSAIITQRLRKITNKQPRTKNPKYSFGHLQKIKPSIQYLLPNHYVIHVHPVLNIFKLSTQIQATQLILSMLSIKTTTPNQPPFTTKFRQNLPSSANTIKSTFT